MEKDLNDILHEKISIMSVAVFGASEFIRRDTGETLGIADGLTNAFFELEEVINKFKDKALNNSEATNESNKWNALQRTLSTKKNT